ncbi:MAG: Ig domain-containing protein, partial [Bdellovibrionota bacterium]|nr:Ig domain-containing protein [Bdellovibrionota bacterium]
KPTKGDDEDIDLQKLTFSCSLKEEKESAFIPCNTKIRGMIFDQNKGILKWNTDYFHSGKYVFKITANDNDAEEPKSSSQEFNVVVKNVNRPPNLSNIENQKIKEMEELGLIDPNDISKLIVPIEQARIKTPGKTGPKKIDEDIDLQNITYSCLYDKKADGIVDKTNKGEDCSKIKGLNFEVKTGKIKWVPDYTQSGLYELKIVAVDDDPIPLKSSKVFTIEVENINRAPDLISIDNQETKENQSIKEVDANDKTSNGDKDIDLEVLTYKCFYDETINEKLDGTKECTSLRGVSFLENSGKVNWKPDYFQAGNYEFTIIATDGGKINNNGAMVDSKDSETFSVIVKNSNRAPKLADIDDQTINENEAIIDINSNDNSNLTADLKKIRPNNPTKGGDEDIDLQKLTFSCSLKEENEKKFGPCKDPFRGIQFDKEKGLLKWKTDFF